MLQTNAGTYLNIEKACSASKPSPKANAAKATHGPGATIDGTSSPASRGWSVAAVGGNPVDVSMAHSPIGMPLADSRWAEEGAAMGQSPLHKGRRRSKLLENHRERGRR